MAKTDRGQDGGVRGSRERGSLLLAIIVEIAIGMILFAVAGQRWSDVRRRDAEADMFARAREIQLGLLRYQRDRGSLPTEFKQLMEPGSRGQYFLRRLYKDPLVKDGKWGLIYQGPDGAPFDPTQTDTPATREDPQAGEIGTSQNTLTEGPVAGLKPLQGSPSGDVTGLPILGVKSKCTDPPFRFWNDNTEYAQMKFTIYEFQPNRQAGQPGAPGAVGAPGTGGPGTRPVTQGKPGG